MSTKEKGVSCYDKAGSKEELFVLRAQDATSHIVVCEWIKQNIDNSRMSDDKLREAFECAIKMRHSYMRMPD